MGRRFSRTRKHRRWTPGGDHVVMVRGESVQKWTHKKSPLPSSPLDLHPAPLALGVDGKGVKEGAFFTHNLRTIFKKRTKYQQTAEDVKTLKPA